MHCTALQCTAKHITVVLPYSLVHLFDAIKKGRLLMFYFPTSTPETILSQAPYASLFNSGYISVRATEYTQSLPFFTHIS